MALSFLDARAREGFLIAGSALVLLCLGLAFTVTAYGLVGPTAFHRQVVCHTI